MHNASEHPGQRVIGSGGVQEGRPHTRPESESCRGQAGISSVHSPLGNTQATGGTQENVGATKTPSFKVYYVGFLWWNGGKKLTHKTCNRNFTGIG